MPEEQMSLDSILHEEKPAPVTEQAPPDKAPPEKSTPEIPVFAKQQWRDKEQDAKGRVRDPATGQYVPKEVKPAAEEVKTEVKPEVVPEVKPEVKPAAAAPITEEYSVREKAAFAKAADETRKRQALEKQLAELKKEPPKPFFDDPEGALARQKSELEEKLNFSILSTKVQTSESIARSRYKDYDEKFTIFNELVQKSPYLAEQAFQSNDPAEFAYQTGMTEKNMREAGGIANMRQKMEEEIRAKVRTELEAELKKKQETLEKERADLPGSLTDVQSKGANRPAWGGPTSFDDILKG